MKGPFAPGALVYGEGGDVFLVLRLLGQGSSAFVYEADDLRSGARVALKFLRAEADSGRLHRERAALRTLRHPNVVRLHSFGTTQGPLRISYLATELLTGASLRTVLDAQGALGIDRALDHGADLFAALAAAQAVSIAHRDVRPENAFVERLGPHDHRLVLHDFGLVCPAHGRLPTAQGIVGDPRYAAPEILYGGPPSFRSDLYAAGLVLFEMITGGHALAPRSDDWRLTHASVQPAQLDLLVPRAPPELVALVASLLAKDARHRPASAAACAEILRALRSELPPDASANATFEDGVDSVLRHIAGPTSEESTQIDPPTESLLVRSSEADDTAECAPPSSSSWPISSR
jgi:serine/threonine protein kinase